MPIPSEIKAYERPRSTEIHAQKGHYYVYKTTSVWDPARKRSRKKTLGCIGKITPGVGFVPSRGRTAPLEAPPVVKRYGLWLVFSQLAPDLLPALSAHLGDDMGSRAYAIAMLRLGSRASNARLAGLYQGSWLSEELPGLPLSEGAMTGFMRRLGSMRGQITAFVRESMPASGATLLFDGTKVLCSSRQMSYARYGRSGKRQVNVMYAFDRTSHRPAFYRLLPGNIADVAAFKATLEESGARDCTIVADKGFFSKRNVAAMDAAGMRYLLPLKDNTTLIDTSFLTDANTHGFDACFDYHDRLIWHTTIPVGDNGKHVHVYRDTSRASLMELNYAKRITAGYSDATLADLKARRGRFGVTILYTNLETDAHASYLDYKARWEIEECFDYLKNGLNLGVVYQRTNEQAEAWALLNHLSLTMFYRLYAAIHNTQLPAKWTPETIMAIASNINRIRINNQWHTSETSKPDQTILNQIGITIPNQ